MAKKVTKQDVINFLKATCQSFGPHEGVTFDQGFWDRLRLNILLLVAHAESTRKRPSTRRSKTRRSKGA